jgi:hypothetical protein
MNENSGAGPCRWFVDRETGSWVLQYLSEDGWVKVPVVFADEDPVHVSGAKMDLSNLNNLKPGAIVPSKDPAHVTQAEINAALGEGPVVRPHPNPATWGRDTRPDKAMRDRAKAKKLTEWAAASRRWWQL